MATDESPRFRVTFGHYLDDTWSSAQEISWDQLGQQLADFKVGQKEGTCIVPAEFRGDKRAKNDAETISLVFLDLDDGTPLDEIRDALEAKEWAALVHSTHSHLTTTTKVKASNYDRYKAASADGTATSYLIDEKGMRPDVAAGAVARDGDDGCLLIEHQPCPKYRVVLVLSRPWVASSYTSQDEANDTWAERLNALAHDLGIPIDQACKDTSRLFYRPRHKGNGVQPEFLRLAGGACDIWALPAAPAAEPEQGAPNGFDINSLGLLFPEAVEFTDPETGEIHNLTGWAHSHGHSFEIVKALKARRPGVFVDKIVGGKHHLECPNAEQHTDPGRDHATIVINASEANNRGFAIHCRHAHCAKRDRLIFLKQMLGQDWLSMPDLTNAEFLTSGNTGSTGGRLEPPRPLFREIPDPEPYPVDALGEILGGAAAAIHDITQAPLALCAQSVLGAAALAVQGHADVVLSEYLRRPLSLSLLSIAKSGERKTTCDDMALAPIKEREEQLRDKYEAQLPDYRNKHDAWQKQREQILRQKKSTLIEIEADLREIGPEPVAPIEPMLVCPEPTFEGLCKALAIGQPSMGVFSNEGGQFVGGHGMSPDNRLKTAAAFSKLWDGDPIKRVRAGDATVTLPGRRVSLHLMIQPRAAMEFLGDDSLIDQGLLSRMLATYPTSTLGSRFSRDTLPESKAAYERYCDRLTAILRTPPVTKEGSANELEPRDLPLSEEAAGTFLVFSDHVEGQLGPDGELAGITGFGAKLSEHAARIAGVLALIEDLEAIEVSTEAADQGIDLAQYYAGEALRLFEAGATKPDLLIAQRVLEWLQDWPEPAVSLPDIYRGGPRKVRDKTAARKFVNILVDHGWLIPMKGGATIKGAVRQEAWQIVRGGQ